MSIEENAKQLCSILMPTCLIICPIGFFGGIYVFLTDSRISEISLADNFFGFL